MDIHYTPRSAEAGKTCADCANFQAKPEDQEKGDCFGHEVMAAGSCNMFQKKA